MATEPTNTFKPLPALLGWLIPGLGHVRIGERGRGMLVFAGVAFLWICGLLIGGIDSVDRKGDRLWFFAQAGTGPIAFAIDGLNNSLLKTGRIGELMESPGPRGTDGRTTSVMVSSFKSVAHANEYGTLYTSLAGLMNVVALLDAGSRRRRTRRAGDAS
jgi:hypothetical protein